VQTRTPKASFTGVWLFRIVGLSAIFGLWAVNPVLHIWSGHFVYGSQGKSKEELAHIKENMESSSMFLPEASQVNRNHQYIGRVPSALE